MPMNVKQLREVLADLPDDMPVIVQHDAEGNGFSLLAGADGVNQGYSKKNHEVHYLALTPYLKEQGYGEEDTDPDGTPCVVLWPV